jgi:hypothetical protein
VLALPVPINENAFGVLSRGKRRDSFYSKKNFGVEAKYDRSRVEYEWSISGVEVEYELSYFTISHCTPLLLQRYSARTPLVLLFQRSTSGVRMEYEWSRNSWSLAFPPCVLYLGTGTLHPYSISFIAHIILLPNKIISLSLSSEILVESSSFTS